MLKSRVMLRYIFFVFLGCMRSLYSCRYFLCRLFWLCSLMVWILNCLESMMKVDVREDCIVYWR